MNTEDETALYEFSRAGNLKEIKYYLHDVKVDPNKAQGYDGSNALMAAAICGHNDAVTLLLTNKASIDDRCEDGSTALMYAAMHGRTDTAALLLDHKADIALQNSNGSSPLHMAAYRGHTTTAALLLQRGASITQEGEWGAALEYAREGKQTHTAEFLSRYIRTGDLRVLARPTQETIDGGAGQHKGDHRDTHTGTGSGEEEASRALSAHGEGKETTRIRSKL